MDAAYLQAAVPKPFRILEQSLEPFCLGHELLFQRFGNRFSVESKDDPAIEDLITGVFICSQPYHPSVSLDGIKLPFRARFNARLFGGDYLGNAYGLFADYIAAHTAIPDFYSKDGGPRQVVGTPTIQAVKVSLMSNMGMSEIEALNTPFSLAFWNHLSWLEAQGSIQIIDDQERERQKLAKELEAKIIEIGRRIRPC